MRYRDELKMSFTKISPIKSADGSMMKISLKSHALFTRNFWGWDCDELRLKAPLNPLMDPSEISDQVKIVTKFDDEFVMNLVEFVTTTNSEAGS